MILQGEVWPCPSNISRYLLNVPWCGTDSRKQPLVSGGGVRGCIGSAWQAARGPARAHQGAAALLWWSMYHQLESAAVSSASGPDSSSERGTQTQRDRVCARNTASQWLALHLPSVVWHVRWSGMLQHKMQRRMLVTWQGWRNVVRRSAGTRQVVTTCKKDKNNILPYSAFVTVKYCIELVVFLKRISNI